MFTPENKRELEEHGVTMVPNVISSEDCDRHQAFYRDWVSSFPPGQFPQSKNSLVQKYSTAHMQSTWEARLAAKQVFAQIWGTEKLLSSMDAVAIGRPPEQGQEKFWSPTDNWLHLDQTADRVGLHAYQGAVYLETCEKEDWTFEVIKGSHKYFEQFSLMTQQWRCKSIPDHQIKWFETKDCKRVRVPCPKGGMILWDSRLFHANARPILGRSHPERWRCVVFVSMTPAWWAKPEDLAMKRTAYEKQMITTHWSSQGVKTFSPKLANGAPIDPNKLTLVSEAGRSTDALRLAGMMPYEKNRKEKVPDFSPVWNQEPWADAINSFNSNSSRGVRTAYSARGRDRRKAHDVSNYFSGSGGSKF